MLSGSPGPVGCTGQAAAAITLNLSMPRAEPQLEQLCPSAVLSQAGFVFLMQGRQHPGFPLGSPTKHLWLGAEQCALLIPDPCCTQAALNGDTAHVPGGVGSQAACGMTALHVSEWQLGAP